MHIDTPVILDTNNTLRRKPKDPSIINIVRLIHVHGFF